jgi:hypothetical protein
MDVEFANRRVSEIFPPPLSYTEFVEIMPGVPLGHKHGMPTMSF